MIYTGSTASWRVWLAVVVLGLGSFTIVTAELAPIGLLSPIARDMGQTEAHAGLIVTVYAWVAAAAALLSATVLGKGRRKLLLTGLMLMLALSSAGAALTTSFAALLSARVVGAIAHGLFWALIGTAAAQIAPTRHLGLATSIIYGGVSIASVLGVPLANVIGHIETWRVAFGVIAAISFATTFAIAIVVPEVEATAEIGLAGLTAVLRNRSIVGIYFALACAITAHFACFTFIEPLLVDSLKVPSRLLSAFFFAFGFAGLLGNFVTGVFVDRHLKPLVVTSLLLIGSCVFGLGSIGTTVGLVADGILIVGWGLGLSGVFAGFQTWMLRQAGHAATAASAIYVAIFNAAIGTGALAGSVILSRTSPAGLAMTSAITVGVSLVCVLLLDRPKTVSQQLTVADHV